MCQYGVFKHFLGKQSFKSRQQGRSIERKSGYSWCALISQLLQFSLVVDWMEKRWKWYILTNAIFQTLESHGGSRNYELQDTQFLLGSCDALEKKSKNRLKVEDKRKNPILEVYH